MSQAEQLYCVFETAMGFCAIGWSEAGVTRFQLPTRSAEGAERLMRRRAFGAERGAPPGDIAAVIAAAKRYFDGEETDFSHVRLDLGGGNAFFAEIYAALRRVGWGRTTTYGALAKEVGAGREAARDVGEAMGKNPTPLIIPVTECSPPAARSAASRRLAARGPRCACWNSRASASRRPRQRSNPLASERGRNSRKGPPRRLVTGRAAPK
jgi:methylated-DNA-[protein]-cysteine S-methyltransferase